MEHQHHAMEEEVKRRAVRQKPSYGKEKVGAVMGEFKRGTLHSGSGKKVSNPKQAIAIAMSEAGMAKKNKRLSPSNEL